MQTSTEATLSPAAAGPSPRAAEPPEIRSEPPPVPRAAAQTAAAAVIVYQFLLVLLIPLRPDLDPSWRTLSEWAIGPFGWLMSVAFLASALAYGTLLFALWRQVSGLAGWAGLGLLGLSTLGTAGAGIFTTDPFETPPEAFTATGTAHMVSAFAGLMLLPFAALLLNVSLARRSRAWARNRRPLLGTAALPLIALAVFWAHLAVAVIPLEVAHGPGVPLGWPPRILLLVYMGWLITLSWCALRTHAYRAGPGDADPTGRITS